MPKLDHSQYWQRSSASESIYLQGPKVQEMLTHDIAKCVTEIRELERLGHIKNGIPTDKNGRVPDPDERKILGYDSYDRDGHLMSEQMQYHDFETCMSSKGWERVKYVPYDVSEDAKLDYYENLHDGYKRKIDAANRKRSSSSANDYEVNE